MHNISELQVIVEEAIKQLRYPSKPDKLYAPISYIMSLGGKRIRPVLVLMAAELFEEDLKEPLHAAMAIETFHNFTLIHDDIMDNAPLRRGKITVHEKWGVNNAILSGDVMMVEANKQLSNLDISVLKRALFTFNSTAQGVCQGQQLDMEFEDRDDVTLEEYIEMIRLKTAVLIGGALKLGAEVANASVEDAENLYSFGENLGIAFQLQDDILDVYASPEKFGKQIGGDIISNKKTWLMLQAIQEAESEEILTMLQVSDGDEALLKVKTVTEIYNKYKIKELAETQVKIYIDKAMQALDNIKVADERKVYLRTLTQKLMVRDN